MLNKIDAKNFNLNDSITSLNEFGYIIIENILDSVKLQHLHRGLGPFFSSRPLCQANFFGFNTTRIEALFSKSVVVQEMATNKQILGLVDSILGKNCDGFQINLTQGIKIHPGEKPQLIHPDSALFPIANKPFEFVVNALWAYTDFKRENGATIIIPGSHKWPETREPKPEEIQYAEMPAGSVLLYQASLLHGGGGNLTDQSRVGIAISYCLGWLRQSENQYLSYPIETVRTFSTQLQKLIGYNVHRPNLGWVNGHDPIEIIEGTASQKGAEDFMTDEQNALLKKYHSGEMVALTNHDL